jgi:hypothetical protein
VKTIGQEWVFQSHWAKSIAIVKGNEVRDLVLCEKWFVEIAGISRPAPKLGPPAAPVSGSVARGVARPDFSWIKSII